METRIGKEDANFHSDGEHSAEAQAEIISAYIHAQLVKQISLYGVATVFILAACFVVVFAPSGREQVTSIIAAALFALSIGLGGFSYFRIKAPLVAAEVGVLPSKADVGLDHSDERK